MDLSLIQKEILITLITLYHRHSRAIKGEEIADVLKRNPGTVRNQMQSLKALELVDGVPGPKGGYNPSEKAYRELNVSGYDQGSHVMISRNDEEVEGANVSEIDFTTLCHPDICHALIRIIGSVKIFEIGDEVTIGPTPVNKLLLRGEVFGKDEAKSSLLISISEMISLPKKSIRHYMSAPLISLLPGTTLKEATHLFARSRIHGAPVMDGERLLGIVTLTDLAKAYAKGFPSTTPVSEAMTSDVIEADAETHLYEVIRRFKEREIGRLIVVDGGKPVGIITQSDIIGVFPAL
ncbi:putative signal transduction protein with CBS domains [Methanofollis liminatans DSM 4140]|uniref:Putative signal transduction protein with CBS domains n=1 Tax=Methanofollis liminatans DSM 4140 TaxID=28892 RepID=J1AS15_9EURY|nr:CBS domain-containing protein [Methanofollis liminatans]EJG07818.1 putative signal transduction protein with CBS domains [Methanofollis liminatans DSM 4140]